MNKKMAYEIVTLDVPDRPKNTPKVVEVADVPDSMKPTEEKTDWAPWAMSAGGGLVAHAIASALVDKTENEKRKESVWSRLMRTLFPIGAGVAGAYGAYKLGKGIKTAESVKKAAPQQFAKINLGEPKMNADGKLEQKTTVVPPEYGDIGDEAAKWGGKTIGDFFGTTVPDYKSNRENWSGWTKGIGTVSGAGSMFLGGKALYDLWKSRGLSAARREVAAIPQQSEYLMDQVSGKSRGVIRQRENNIAKATSAAEANLASKEMHRSRAAKNGLLGLLGLGLSGGAFYMDNKASDAAKQLGNLRAWAQTQEGQDAIMAHKAKIEAARRKALEAEAARKATAAQGK